MLLVSDKTESGIPVAELCRDSKELVGVICQRCGKVYKMQWASYQRAIRAGRKNGKSFASRICLDCWRSRTRNKNKEQYKLPKARVDSFRRKTGIHIPATFSLVKHRVAAAYYLGRALTGAEFVHHVNGNRDDNREQNIVVLNHTAHTEAHKSLTAIAWRMVKSDLILYDRALNKYLPSCALMAAINGDTECMEKSYE
jgi:DNA-directed RNA polymerase subunit N (RpoN/RPB10)